MQRSRGRCLAKWMHYRRGSVMRSVRRARIAMKAKSLPLSFRLSTILFLMALVGIILWLLTPSPADLVAEKKLIGTWEIRLTETLDPTTETRIVEYRVSDLVGTARRVFNSHMGSSGPKHYWCVRNGVLIDGWQHLTPRESEYKIIWTDDDNFALEFIGLDGGWTKVYNRRLKSKKN